MDEVQRKFEAKIDVSLSQRGDKSNHELALFTNVVKASLIDAYCSSKARSVLDIGCGRGSDSSKFERAGVTRYVGTDLTDSQIQEGVQRQNRCNTQRKNGLPTAEITLLNISHQKLNDARIQAFAPYDTVTSFLSLHFLFGSSKETYKCLHCLSSYLRPQGHFICVVPDGDCIQEHLKDKKHFGDISTGFYERNDAETNKDARRCDKSSYTGSASFESIAYFFSLQGSFSQLPESCISTKSLRAIAATAQLSLVESFTFEDFLSHLSYSESAMLESGISRIRARDLLKKMSKDAPLSRMKTQGLYRCFVFRKGQG